MLFTVAIVANPPVGPVVQRVNYVAGSSTERSRIREVAYSARSLSCGGYVVFFSATAALRPSARSARVSSLNRSS
jgi:hypothetical protein